MIYSFLSPKCEIRKSYLHGDGIFAKEHLMQGELVFIMGGPVHTAEELRITPHSDDNQIQIYEGIYLGAFQKNRDEYPFAINHSCNPNIGVKGQSVFLTRRVIFADEELCFDYGTTEMAYSGWIIHCQCGNVECRGVIDGNAWKDPRFQKKHRGWFSWYLEQKIEEE